MTSRPAGARSATRRRLVRLGAFFAYGVGLSGLYAATGAGLPCPFRWLTGWQCPFCGGTRLGAALLHGDVATAFLANPVLLVALAWLGVLGVLWAVELAGGPALRPPRRLREWSGALRPNHWLAAALVLGTAYTVLRNLL